MISSLPIRPSKDEYYLGIAKAVSVRSTCLRRHYGVVIVNNDEIIATGYNGNPRGIKNCCEIEHCSKLVKSHNSNPDSYNICRSVHAEQNALISAKRSEMIGATLYIYGFDYDDNEAIENAEPCPICLRMIQNAGIKRIVNTQGDVQCLS